MAISSSLSLSWVSTTIPDKFQLTLPNHNNELPRATTTAYFSSKNITCSPEPASIDEKIPEKYRAFVDKEDGYSYYYPYDWRDFEFRAHDSAFKDRYMQLHNVRVRFLPTNKTDIHELGPMEEVVSDLVRYKLASPNQYATIFGMQERNIDGKNYYTVEYGLQTPNFATNSFATVAIGNGRFYTLIVVANERRWKRYRNQLKVVADSFRMLDI
ncbi:hypothetical protein GBA52_006964 [Prunus armeniaca]|nr:hypothetical protein GBA52_006964 [Prunus armeniaca]